MSTTTAKKPRAKAESPGRFPFYKQRDARDCGPTCLRMIARHHGRSIPLQALRDTSATGKQGVSLLGLSHAAEKVGMRSLAARLPYEQLVRAAPLPCIAHWRGMHWVVVYRAGDERVHVADPAHGLLTYSREEFEALWAPPAADGSRAGIVLLLEPTPAFRQADDDDDATPATGFAFLLPYLRGHRRYLGQVVLGLFLGSLLQLVFPFLTQAVVDFGIARQNLSFVYTLLAAQLMLFFSRTAVDFIRSWIVLHVGARVNIAIVSDFLLKLMKLPMAFFEQRTLGDLLQRVDDNDRIQQFLTTQALSALFAAMTLLIFSAVLALYSGTIFAVFVVGTLLYAVYVWFFMKKRKELDYKRFAQMSSHRNALVELITGIQEIKLTRSEQQKRWRWEEIQARLFRVSISGLALEQAQQGGASFLNELKNITITFLAARLVIQGELTLGMLLAVQYILGQLNSPVAQLIGFMKSAQDARISLERLGEIHEQREEEPAGAELMTTFPPERGLRLSGVAFRYGGPQAPLVLDGVELEVPEGKVTAIVGTSGSGKTTLLKLLLRFYDPVAGEIRVGSQGLGAFSAGAWRDRCGVVMQDGFIFRDTIARNIAVGEEVVDHARLLRAVRTANIQPYVESLPLGYNTVVGNDGAGMSAGQRQRLLIARAVYRDPDYLFFDEATSALDANNERVIMENLERFFEGRTVVVIAHRLSTVKRADQIVVMEGGRIVERGTHAELAALRGKYYELVKNQLELGG